MSTATPPMHITESTNRVATVTEWMADHGHQLPEHRSVDISVRKGHATVTLFAGPGAIDRTREGFGQPWFTAALGGGMRSATWRPTPTITLYVIERPEVAS